MRGQAKFWSDLKSKLVKDDGLTELSDSIGQLKMQASDGKFCLANTVTVETALRVIQSIPSRKTEPFKRWLARVGYERIQEIQDPEIAVKRAVLMWQAQGRTSDWIEARLRCIVVRREKNSRRERSHRNEIQCRWGESPPLLEDRGLAAARHNCDSGSF